MSDLPTPDDDDAPAFPDDVLPPGAPAGLGGLGDLGGLLAQAQQMQEQLLAAQAESAARVVEGHAGGGVVRIEVTGGLEFRAVHISPDAVDPDDPSLLEDLVLAALHDAMDRIGELQHDAMGGLDLGGLGGLLGET